MAQNELKCARNCKNSCQMLNEALRRETNSVQFYESVMDDCNSPEIKKLVQDIIEERREEILKIIQKLNEIHARSQALDGIAASFHR